MNYYIFGNSKPIIKKRKRQALLQTIDLENAFLHFEKYVTEVYDRNLYLVMDLTPKSTKTRKLYGEDKMNFLVIAEWHLGDSFDIVKSIRSDYIIMKTQLKKIEINSNKRVAELIEYHVKNRIYAEFDVKIIQKYKYHAPKVYQRSVLNVAEYLATQKLPDYDPFMYDYNCKFVVDLSMIDTVEMPRRFLSYNMRFGKFDQDMTDDEKEMNQAENKNIEANMKPEDKKIDMPKIAML